MNCEICGKVTCQCDLNQNDPIDCSVDDWREIYSGEDGDDLMDRDTSMNG